MTQPIEEESQPVYHDRNVYGSYNETLELCIKIEKYWRDKGAPHVTAKPVLQTYDLPGYVNRKGQHRPSVILTCWVIRSNLTDKCRPPRPSDET